MKTILKKTSLAVAGLVLGAAVNANAASGSVNTSISFNGGIIILYYATDYTLTVQPEFFVGSGNADTGVLDDQTGTAYNLDGSTTPNLNVATSGGPTITNTGSVKLQNAYAIRGVNWGGGNHQVQISNTATSAGSGTNTVSFSNWAVDCANNTGSAGTTIQCTPQGLGNIQYGDVSFDIDLSNADGSSTIPVSGFYTLTVTNL